MCMANVFGGQHNSSVCDCGSSVVSYCAECGSRVCGSLKSGFSVVIACVVSVCVALVWF